MKKRKDNSLEHRLMAYSAAATAVLTMAPVANANIYHSGPQTLIVNPFSSQTIDLNGDGVPDFDFDATTYTHTSTTPDRRYVNHDARLFVLPLSSNSILWSMFYSKYGVPAYYPAGALLSGSLATWHYAGGVLAGNLIKTLYYYSSFSNGNGKYYHTTVTSVITSTSGNFLNRTGYLGVRFTSASCNSGSYHYGWIQFSGAPDATVGTIIDWAYELNCNQPVLTGLIPTTVVSPNGGEVIPSGSSYTISWSVLPGAVTFDLDYSINDGNTWRSIATGVTGTSYDWSVPVVAGNKRKCLVRVTAYDRNGALIGQDISDTRFRIEVVRITSPNGGEVYNPGDSISISWQTNTTKTTITKVVLKYHKVGVPGWNLIDVIKGGNPGSYNWTIPSGFTPGQYRLKVNLWDANKNRRGADKTDGLITIQ